MSTPPASPAPLTLAELRAALATAIEEYPDLRRCLRHAEAGVERLLARLDGAPGIRLTPVEVRELPRLPDNL